MIDLHTHTIFSDGVLIPSELIRRAAERGYRAIALTDHADHSNFDFIIPRILRVARKLESVTDIRIIAGIELTHVHPSDISGLVDESRALGAELIVVHGETIVEPVLPGTNRAALEAGVDILAHPGLISGEDTALAAETKVCLEISARKGHSLTNGHVADLARRFGARLVLNTDAHGPGDLISKEMARRVAAGAGLTQDEINALFENSEALCRRIGPS